MAAALEMRSLTRDFGRVRAVDNLTLAVEEGQMFGFLGPNGAGKTTTMRMLLGLVRPSRGHAWILGEPSSSPRARRPGTIGALVEEPAFYGYLTGRRNLTLLARLSGGVPPEEVERALGLVGLQGQGDRRVSAYSHGMRQRLGVAQALLPRPRVLLLDEPTLGLDPRGQVEFRELLVRLNRAEGLTVFLSSHLLAEVEMLCRHVGLLFRGRLLASGLTGELLRRGRVRVELRAAPVEQAWLVLAEHPQVRDLVRQEERLVFSAHEEALAGINERLVSRGVQVSALIPRVESLEDYYLRLTGEEAGDAGRA